MERSGDQKPDRAAEAELPDSHAEDSCAVGLLKTPSTQSLVHIWYKGVQDRAVTCRNGKPRGKAKGLRIVVYSDSEAFLVAALSGFEPETP